MTQHAKSEAASVAVAQSAQKAHVVFEIELCGEVHKIDPGDTFTIGRVGTLTIEDNPFLHRNFLVIELYNGLWWVSNISLRIVVTVAETTGMLQSWVGPGSQTPLIVPDMSLVFIAGPTTYEINMAISGTMCKVSFTGREDVGETAMGQVTLTSSQCLLIPALIENWLRRVGVDPSDISRSKETAQCLGWTQTRLNRKLDNVCEKLDRFGVCGSRGRKGVYVTYRRARPVEYVVTSRLVTADDLTLLDEESQTNQWQKAAEGFRRPHRRG